MSALDTIVSLQILESVKVAGDDYPTWPSLLVKGLADTRAAAFGSPFLQHFILDTWRTSVWRARGILHPQWSSDAIDMHNRIDFSDSTFCAARSCGDRHRVVWPVCGAGISRILIALHRCGLAYANAASWGGIAARRWRCGKQDRVCFRPRQTLERNAISD